MNTDTIMTPLILPLIGLVFLITGWVMQAYPPVWPNVWYGYRTPKSLSNKLLFDEGNRYSARLIKRIGLGMVALGGLYYLIIFLFKMDLLLVKEGWIALALCVPILGAVMLLLISTERHLMRFEREGRVSGRL